MEGGGKKKNFIGRGKEKSYTIKRPVPKHRPKRPCVGPRGEKRMKAARWQCSDKKGGKRPPRFHKRE